MVFFYTRKKVAVNIYRKCLDKIDDDIFDLIYGHNSKSMGFIVRSNNQIALFEKIVILRLKRHEKSYKHISGC